MFGKYFLHELKNTYRSPLIICLVSLLIPIFAGLSIITENGLIITMGILLFLISIVAMVVSIFINIIKTYSSRLFNQQGYLTLTLPVGTHTILLAKILVNLLYFFVFIVDIILMFALFISTVNLTTGDTSGMGYILKEAVGIIYNVDYSFLYNFLHILNYVMAYLWVNLVVLFILSLKRTGWNKVARIIIIIVILALYVFLISYSEEMSVHCLYYIKETDTFMLATPREAFAYMNKLYNEGNYYDISSIFNVMQMSIYVVSIILGYIGSYLIVSRKLDIC